MLSIIKSNPIALLFLSTAIAVSGYARAINNEPVVIPKLQSWSGGTGDFVISSTTRLVLDPQESSVSKNNQVDDFLVDQTVSQVVAHFDADLNTLKSIDLSVVETAATRANDIVFDLDTSLANIGSQGYKIDIGSNDKITIKAKTSTGLYYATRTLLQILKQDANTNIPKGIIEDYPGLKGRMVMLDAGRKYWEIDYLKDFIRQMSWQKMNTFFFHFSEGEAFRLKSNNFSELNMPDNLSYSKSEIQDLDNFAKQHHVVIIPGFEFPGHASVLSDVYNIGFDSSGCNNSHMNNSHIGPNFVIDMTSTAARQKVDEIVDEFITWFSGPFVHIGGDEVDGGLSRCPTVSNYIASQSNISSFGDLMIDFVNEMDVNIRGHNKKTLIYDGIDHLSSPSQNLNSEIIFTMWESTTPPAGHQYFMLNPTSTFYLTPNNYHSIYANRNTLYNSWSPDQSSNSLGAGLSVWADYNMDADDQYFEDLLKPRRAVFSTRSWNTNVRNDGLVDFDAREALIGTPPNYTGFATLIRNTSTTPINHYSFDNVSYPQGWHPSGNPGQTIWAEDIQDNLHGSSYIINNPTIGVGKIGSSFVIDSDGDGIGLGGVNIPPPWSVSMWVKRTANSTESVLLASNEFALKLEQWNSGSRVGFTENGVADHQFEYITPLNTWTHLTITASASTSQTKLYLNGNHDTSHVINTAIDLPRQAFGRRGKFMRGELDNTHIFTKELTASEVASIHKIATAKYRFDFDEGSGLTLTDSMHSGVTGVISNNNSAPSFVDGVRTTSKALSFDGNDQVVFNSVPEITGDWTVGVWLKRTANSTSETILAGGSTAIRSAQYNNTNKVGFTVFGSADHSSSYELPLNQWVFLTLVRVNNTISIYADGTLKSTLSNAGSSLSLNRLGASNPNNSVSSSDFFNGDLDDLIIFDQALSASDVAVMYDMFAR